MSSTAVPVRYENIRVEKKNQIAYVTIARPKVLNALSIATIEELRQVFHDVKNDSEVRAAIITGEGEKAFVAGADIQELAVETPISGKEYSRSGHAVFELIENLGKPVIAAINGFTQSSASRKSNSASFPDSTVPSACRASWAKAWRCSCF
jgi:enoyl-CoA hydratase